MPLLASSQVSFSYCSASFETACAVAYSYNLVVQMQMKFQNANQSTFTSMAQQMNQGQGPFVNGQMASDLYGFLWFRNGTCVGHPLVCRNQTQSMDDYIENNDIITIPFLNKLLGSAAYYAGGKGKKGTKNAKR